MPSDQPETRPVSTEHLAWAFNVYEPEAGQACAALVAADHPEEVPSPQSNWYSTPWPSPQTDPPLAKVYEIPCSPRDRPDGI